MSPNPQLPFAWWVHVCHTVVHSRAWPLFMCGRYIYWCLPAKWAGTCTRVLLIPQVDIVPSNQSLPIPLLAHTRSKRAIQVIPLSFGLGLTIAVGTGIGGITSSFYYYKQLSENLAEDMEQVAKSMTIQDQIDSLVAVVLQNWRGLDLLTAEKWGLCLFLNEECCFFTNQTGHGPTTTRSNCMQETRISKLLG